MSSSRQNDLQQVEKNSNQSPAKIVLQEPLGITRKELDIVYLTAQFAAMCGMHFEQELIRSVSMNPVFEPMFQFMNPTDSRRGFFDEVTLEYTRRLPPPSQYTSGRPSIATDLEIFFNIVRHVIDHKEEATKMDVTYFNDTDCFEPSQWRPPLPGLPCHQRCSVNDMKFAVGGLDAYRDCEWYDWAVSKRKEFNDYLLLRKTEYKRQFPDEEPIPMSPGLGEYHAPSTIKDDSDHSASLKENMSDVGAGETLNL